MKIRDLIAELSKLDPELDVVIAKDAEGNGYSPCSGAWPGNYTPESTWSGDWRSLGDEPSEDGDCSAAEVNAVVLFPVN